MFTTYPRQPERGFDLLHSFIHVSITARYEGQNLQALQSPTGNASPGLSPVLFAGRSPLGGYDLVEGIVIYECRGRARRTIHFQFKNIKSVVVANDIMELLWFDTLR